MITKLETIRINSGRTREQVAKQLKLNSPQSVYNWEVGYAPVPAKHIKKLAKVIKVDPELLLGMVLTTRNTAFRKAAKL